MSQVLRILFLFYCYFSGSLSHAMEGDREIEKQDFEKKAFEQQSIKKIVALSPHSVELLYAVGAGHKIVATVDFADYPPEAKNIRRVGNYNGLQVEQIVALEPDLIVAWKSGNKLADLNKLESLGLNILYTQPKNIAQISDELIKLGGLAGDVLLAREVALALKNRHQAIKDKYHNRRPVTVFYQLWHEPMRTVGPSSWIASLMEDCNGDNIFSATTTDYPIVALEDVITSNPQVIVIPHHSGSEGAKTSIWDKWPEIEAVKNKRIYTLSGDLLHRFGPRALDGLEKLCLAIDSAR